MTKTTNTNPAPQKKRGLWIKLGIIGAAVALVVGSVPMLDSISSDAATSDGKFCVQAVSDAGKFKGQSGWKDCGDGAVPIEEPTDPVIVVPPAIPATGIVCTPLSMSTIRLSWPENAAPDATSFVVSVAKTTLATVDRSESSVTLTARQVIDANEGQDWLTYIHIVYLTSDGIESAPTTYSVRTDAVGNWVTCPNA